MHHPLNLTHPDSIEADVTEASDHIENLCSELNSPLCHVNHVHHEDS